MEEPEKQLSTTAEENTPEKLPVKTTHNFIERKTVGIILVCIGVLGITFFALKLSYYIILSHAPEEIRKKEYDTICLNSIEKHISESLSNNTFMCIFMSVIILFGLYLIFLTRKIRIGEVILIAFIAILILLPAMIFAKNRLYTPVCEVGTGIDSSISVPLSTTNRLTS